MLVINALISSLTVLSAWFLAGPSACARRSSRGHRGATAFQRRLHGFRSARTFSSTYSAWHRARRTGGRAAAWRRCSSAPCWPAPPHEKTVPPGSTASLHSRAPRLLAFTPHGTGGLGHAVHFSLLAYGIILAHGMVRHESVSGIRQIFGWSQLGRKDRH